MRSPMKKEGMTSSVYKLRKESSACCNFQNDMRWKRMFGHEILALAAVALVVAKLSFH